MSTHGEFERFVHDWLEQRVVAPPTDGLERALERIPAMSSRPRWRYRWSRRALGETRPIEDHDPADHDRRRNGSMLMTTGTIAGIAGLMLAAIVVLPLGHGDGQRLSGSASQATHVVAADGSGDFSSITDAIAAATDGDIVTVRPGTYRESVIIDKDVLLIGDGSVEEIVVGAPSDGPVHPFDAYDGGRLQAPYSVLLLESEATVSGLTFRGVPSTLVIHGGAPTVESVVFDGTGCSFWTPRCPDGSGESRPSLLVTEGSGMVIRGNRVVAGGPIELSPGVEPLIEGNEISGGAAIVGAPGRGAVIRGNTITGDVFHAIELASSSALLIESNRISGADVGIRVGPTPEGETPTQIRDNTMGSNGIAIESLTNSATAAIGNTLEANQSGVAVGPGATVSVEGNEFVGNATGIRVMGATDSPVVQDNSFCRNDQDLEVPDGSTVTLDPSNEVCAD